MFSPLGDGEMQHEFCLPSRCAGQSPAAAIYQFPSPFVFFLFIHVRRLTNAPPSDSVEQFGERAGQFRFAKAPSQFLPEVAHDIFTILRLLPRSESWLLGMFEVPCLRSSREGAAKLPCRGRALPRSGIVDGRQHLLLDLSQRNGVIGPFLPASSSLAIPSGKLTITGRFFARVF